MFGELFTKNDLNSENFKVFIKKRTVCMLDVLKMFKPITLRGIALLNKIFNCIEPILIKLSRQKEQADEIKNLHKSLHNLSILYNISQAVNFIDDLKGLIQVILGKALETIDAEKGSLMLYDYTDNTLQVKVVFGLQDAKQEFDITNGVMECTKLQIMKGCG
jgi:nitrate/nitrite-specific signal transduction histidine kinase